MRLGHDLLTFALVLLCALPLAALGDTLVVLNKSDNEAALVDPVTYQVLAKLPTGRGPHEVAASPDGRYAYVSNYGALEASRKGEKPKWAPGNTITVLDLKERAVKATYDLGSYTQPHGIRASPDSTPPWVTGKILKVWKTEQQVSQMVVPTPDERKLYVANIGSGSVSVINRASGAVATIPTAAGSEGIAVSPDSREVWVVNRAAGTLAVIDTAADRVVTSFVSGGKFPIRVKFTPDGKQVLVSNAESNGVAGQYPDQRGDGD